MKNLPRRQYEPKEGVTNKKCNKLNARLRIKIPAHQTASYIRSQAYRLLSLDTEMTGRNPPPERIHEETVEVNYANLQVVGERPVLVIHQSDELLDAIDDWNKSTHGRSGLIEKVKKSTLTESEAEEQILQFLGQHLKENTSPLCGNTISQDRRFMYRYMPRLEEFFHYRNLYVSTLKELSKRWKPDVVSSFKKEGNHEALADINESIVELKHYREHFIRL